MVEDALAEDILKGRFADGSVIRISQKGNEIVFNEVERKKPKKSDKDDEKEKPHKVTK